MAEVKQEEVIAGAEEFFNALFNERLVELNAAVKRILKIDQASLDDEEFRLIRFRHQIIETWTVRLGMLSSYKGQLAKVKAARYRYYKNDAPERTDTQKERDIYVEGDKDYLAAKEKFDNVDLSVKYLEQVIKEIDEALWAVRSSMKFRQFLGGHGGI